MISHQKIVIYFLYNLSLLSSSLSIETIKLIPNQVKTLNLLSNSTNEIAIDQTHIDDDDATEDEYWIFESHTRKYPLQLNSTFKNFESVMGNHLGINVIYSSNNSTEIYLSNPHEKNVTAVLILRGGYSISNYAIPGQLGGPNFINVTFDSHTTYARFKNSEGTNGTITSDLSYQVFQYFINEYDDSDQVFIQSMSQMLTKESIKKYGSIIDGDYLHKMSQDYQEVTFASYPGTGRIISVIVNGGNYSATYVSGASYGCTLGSPDCNMMSNIVIKVTIGFAVFVGLFLALYGHRFFITSQLIYGMFCMGFVSYIMTNFYFNLNNNSEIDDSHNPWIFGLTITGSLLGGFIWVVLWFFFGIPILSVVMSSLATGILIACIVMFATSSNVPFFILSGNYWYTFTAILCATPIVLICLARTASIFNACFIGTFFIILALDFYIGGSLKYILINVFHRAIIVDYNFNVMTPPFQTNDIGLVTFWVLICLFSLLFQHLRERRRAPFPPNPYDEIMWRREETRRITENLVNNESAPLLASSDGPIGESIERHRTEGVITIDGIGGIITTHTRIVGDHVYFDPRELQAANLSASSAVVGHISTPHVSNYGSTQDCDVPLLSSTMPSAPQRESAQLEGSSRRRGSSNVVPNSPLHPLSPRSSGSRNTPSRNNRIQPDIFKPPTPK